MTNDPTTVLNRLKALLQTALTDHLGKYTLPDGTTSPAIALSYDPEYGKGFGKDGLECFVLASPDVAIRDLLDSAVETFQALVMLKNFGAGSLPRDAYRAAVGAVRELEVEHGAQLGRVNRQLPTEELGNIEIYRLPVQWEIVTHDVD